MNLELIQNEQINDSFDLFGVTIKWGIINIHHCIDAFKGQQISNSPNPNSNKSKWKMINLCYVSDMYHQVWITNDLNFILPPGFKIIFYFDETNHWFEYDTLTFNMQKWIVKQFNFPDQLLMKSINIFLFKNTNLE